MLNHEISRCHDFCVRHHLEKNCLYHFMSTEGEEPSQVLDAAEFDAAGTSLQALSGPTTDKQLFDAQSLRRAANGMACSVDREGVTRIVAVQASGDSVFGPAQLPELE